MASKTVPCWKDCWVIVRFRCSRLDVFGMESSTSVAWSRAPWMRCWDIVLPSRERKPRKPINPMTTTAMIEMEWKDPIGESTHVFIVVKSLSKPTQFQFWIYDIYAHVSGMYAHNLWSEIRDRHAKWIGTRDVMHGRYVWLCGARIHRLGINY